VLTEFGIKIAPSTYYAAVKRAPSARAVRDEELKKEIQSVYDDNYRVYGARKIWCQLQREDIEVGRCRVERLMRAMGLAGAVRGKTVRTTVSDKDGVRAADLVKRQFTAGAPNRLWVADFTYVATWAGTVYVSFAIDVFSRKIVGWRARMSKETDLVMDVIDMGLCQREYRPGPGVDKLVHHSDAGSQYQCHLVRRSSGRLVGGRPAVGRMRAVDARVFSWGSCGGFLSWTLWGRCAVCGRCGVRVSRRWRVHGSGVGRRGENAGGSVTCRRTMFRVRVNDSRSGSMSTVSAASAMNARIA
jgi:hypothetical protein